MKKIIFIIGLIGVLGGIVLYPQRTESRTTSMAESRSIPRTGESGPSYDPDYAAYYARVLANGSDLSDAEKTAMQTFIAALKTGGFWDDFTDLYCFIGDDYNAAKTYVKGAADIIDDGTTTLFTGTGTFSREHGFYRNGGPVYEAVLKLNATHSWGSSNPITGFRWGRNSGNGIRLGLHPVKYGDNTYWTYHESAFSYGFQIKAAKQSGSSSEIGFSSSTQDGFSTAGFSFDGALTHKGRRLKDTGSTGGGSLTLSSAQKAHTGNMYLTCGNPSLGVAIMENVDYTNAQLDAVNVLIKDFVDDCGVTLTALDPDI